VVCSFHEGVLADLQAGQALQQVLLTATTLGLSASFLSQPIEVPTFMPNCAASWVPPLSRRPSCASAMAPPFRPPPDARSPTCSCPKPRVPALPYLADRDPQYRPADLSSRRLHQPPWASG
jgi:hypothetical protein